MLPTKANGAMKPCHKPEKNPGGEENEGEIGCVAHAANGRASIANIGACFIWELSSVLLFRPE